MEKHYFGQNLYVKVVLYTIIPLVLSAAMSYMYFDFARDTGISDISLKINIAVMLTLNTGLVCLTSSFMYSDISKGLSKITSTLKSFTLGNLEDFSELPVDLSNQFSYTVYLINEMIHYVKIITEDCSETSVNILETVSLLGETSRAGLEFSKEEAKSVKDSLVKMEKATELLERINGRIKDVHITSEKTKSTVKESSALLETNINKISEITDANLNTITGIKKVSEKIETVWDIINTIDGIAAKTKIIAFNAELEASYAGLQGEKFHIIANEIRRLVSTISDSIHEIKKQVTEIQHSSDNLIITSEAGTQKIREGKEFFVNLESNFSDLKISSDITAESAQQIQERMNSQDASFRQIDLTLKDINRGFDRFSEESQKLNEASEQLKLTAEDLTRLHKKEEQK